MVCYHICMVNGTYPVTGKGIAVKAKREIQVKKQEIQPELGDILTVLKAYNRIDFELKELEAEKKRLREIIDPAVEHAGGRLQIEEYVATLIHVGESESFSYSKAKKGLDKATLRKLKPYVSVKDAYNRLSVKRGE